MSIVRNTNYHQILPIIVEKVHQEKVQQEKLKAVKARLNFEDTSRHSESRTLSRRRGLKERLGPRYARSMSGSPEPRRGRSKSPRERGPKRKTMFKSLERAYSTDLETRRRVCPHTREIQAIGHTTTVAETLKAAIEVLAPEKQNLLLRNIITKDDPRKEQKHCQNARVVQKDIGSQGRRGKSQVLKTTYPKRGKVVAFDQRNKQSDGKDQTKAAKKGETSGKEKPLAILMVQSWQRVAKQRITQTFSLKPIITFQPLGEEDGTKGPMIIKAEMGGHFVHRMYVDGGSSSEILYEHCFNRFRPKVRRQMIPATTPLVVFSEEIIWPLGQISLLVKIGDEEHSTSAWMNFMIVRSSSPYNGIIGRTGVRRIQAVPSTAH
nr:reverse transcriptase domain-containing protein [Tanacetum cinerariifolium]